MMPLPTPADRDRLRLDQWLWFARLAKSRSLAARLCSAGLLSVNGVAIAKPHHPVHVGDIVVLPQGGWRRSVRVIALGARRGPATEARTLYEEIDVPVRLRELKPGWAPLLAEGDAPDQSAPLPGDP
jgi:ribosome-associated heat shock protein Hsp15